MPLETGTFISDLVASNPPGTDLESQGANHLRLLKSVLQNTFPVTGKAFNFPAFTTKSANYSVQKSDFYQTLVANTVGGSFTFTLPSLVAGDAGWFCEFILGSGANPFFIAPPSGTLISGEIAGLSAARRCIPLRKTQAFWSGTAWVLTRVPGVPVGTILDFWSGVATPTNPPQGYEWCAGQTLASASTNYPDYFASQGSSGLVVDLRGRTTLGLDGVGGFGTAGRITAAGGNWDGTTITGGGGQNLALAQSDLPNVAPAVSGITLNDPGHSHTVSVQSTANQVGNAAGSTIIPGGSTATSSVGTGITISSQGSVRINGNVTQTNPSRLPPALTLSKIIVVE